MPHVFEFKKGVLSFIQEAFNNVITFQFHIADITQINCFLPVSSPLDLADGDEMMVEIMKLDHNQDDESRRYEKVDNQHAQVIVLLESQHRKPGETE